MTNRPPRHTTVPPAERATTEARVAVLRAELEVDATPTRRALLQHEIGHLLEHALGEDSRAVREYLSAYNLDPTFRAPLYGMIRIFERRRSFTNLMRLYEAEERAGETDQDRASAVLDQAAYLEDVQQDAAGAAQHLVRARAGS